MAKVLDYSLQVNDFKLQSCYFIQFQTNILGKGIEPIYTLSPTSYGLNSITANLLQGWL